MLIGYHKTGFMDETKFMYEYHKPFHIVGKSENVQYVLFSLTFMFYSKVYFFTMLQTPVPKSQY